jgi:propanol-preferring alcohol dehydrogenase
VILMKAMVLRKQNRPLELLDIPVPEIGPGQLLIKVRACGVCRTDLHIADGDLDAPKTPLVMGHEIVGQVEAVGDGENPYRFEPGDRVGVPWLGWTCRHCHFCRSNHENLCDEARFTGYHINGGYAEFCVADWRYCFRLPKLYDDLHVAPLLCAGLIGYRAFRKTRHAKRIGLYGFGAAAHIVAQIAVSQGREAYAFTRPGDLKAQDFSRRMGCLWSGSSDEMPPVQLDAAIIFAPVGSLVPAGLKSLAKAGRVVAAGIHMSEIPAFPYSLLYGERSVVSVSNLARQDGLEFFDLVGKMTLLTEVHPYSLDQANQALDDLRARKLSGSAVLNLSP